MSYYHIHCILKHMQKRTNTDDPRGKKKIKLLNNY